MESFFNQGLKLADMFKDSIHIHIGLVVFFAAVLFWQKGKITASCLLPVLALALGKEALDLFSDYRSVGYMQWLNSIYDIASTILWPLFLVLFFKIKLVSEKN